MSKKLLRKTFQQQCRNSSSQKFFKINVSLEILTRKSVLESLFNKVTSLKGYNSIKKGTSTQVFSCEYHTMFENIVFYGTPPVAASENGWRFNSSLERFVEKTYKKGFRSSPPEVFCKKGFLKKISQNSQENTCVRPATLLKKTLWHRCFPVNFVKILRTLFFIEHVWWLLLRFVKTFYNRRQEK